MDQLKKHHNKIIQEIKSILNKEITDTPWSKKCIEELSDFCLGGKMVRGSLFCEIINLHGKNLDKEVYNIAACIELAHTSILIHDDIIDNDDFRRGKLTMHKRFKPEQFGKDSAICIADIGFFIAAKNMSKYENKVKNFFYQEMINVALGEIQDCNFNHINPTFNQIIEMYVNKTARYTFELPFNLANLYIGLNKHSEYKKISRHIGIIFQIIDDKIGLLSDSSVIGKPAGSDLIEGKKTIIYKLLENTEYTNCLKENFNLNKARDIYYKEKIDLKLNEIINEHLEEIKRLNEKNLVEKDFFMDLTNYVIERKK